MPPFYCQQCWCPISDLEAWRRHKGKGLCKGEIVELKAVSVHETPISNPDSQGHEYLEAPI